jgi:two-component system, response regulator
MLTDYQASPLFKERAMLGSDQLKILLVEDNPADAKLTKMALQEANIRNEIVHCKDGEEALDYIFSRGVHAGKKPPHAEIGLILLDLKMPKVNGIEVLRELKANDNTKKIPVAVFTSSKENPDVEECYRLGVNTYIVKPLDFGQFASIVKETGLYWIVINHLPQS